MEAMNNQNIFPKTLKTALSQDYYIFEKPQCHKFGT